MFINKTVDGKNNLIGPELARRRIEMQLSQRAFADKLQVQGLEIDKNAIQRIECGKRFVTDIELVKICQVLHVLPTELLIDFIAN